MRLLKLFSLKKRLAFHLVTTDFSAKWAQKFHINDMSLTQNWVVLPIGRAVWEICFNQ